MDLNESIKLLIKAETMHLLNDLSSRIDSQKPNNMEELSKILKSMMTDKAVELTEKYKKGENSQ